MKRRTRTSRFGNNVIRRGARVHAAPTRKSLVWLRDRDGDFIADLQGRRYSIYRHAKLYVLSVKVGERVTRDLGMYNDMHTARLVAENHATAGADRKRTRPSTRSNVARGMITAGTGRAQKFRHKTDRRAKERDQSWRRENWGDSARSLRWTKRAAIHYAEIPQGTYAVRHSAYEEYTITLYPRGAAPRRLSLEPTLAAAKRFATKHARRNRWIR
jgi:hypothetical protein